MNHSLQFTRMWNESDNCFPDGLQYFDDSEKKLKEEQLEYFQEKLNAELNLPAGKNNQQANHHMMHLLSAFFKDTIGYPDGLTEVMFSDGMMDSTWSFIRTARQFDPGICFPDLFQAVRNVWIMNGLQFLMDQPVCLTPPIFAYSMLYPYTDNYLDNPLISSQKKQEFCFRFGKRLGGEDVHAFQEQERKIFRMIELIEGYWNRDQYPKIYESLQGIHEAQTRSMQLITKANSLNFDDIFSICIHKGGKSVVADGFLVLGDLTPEQEEFFYYDGAYLQLLDDLQDVSTDLADSLMTAYSSKAKQEKLDVWLNKTYYLGLKILDCTDRLHSAKVPVFKALMKKSIDLFLTGAVLTNSQFFSDEFISAFEAFSPMSFAFIRQKDCTLSPYQNHLFEQILKRVMTDGDEFSLEPGSGN